MADACTSGLDTGFVGLGFVKVGFLGIVQGVTELLPISSTAHMRIVPALLGWQDPGSAFSASMQLAALAAVVSYFWADVRGLAQGTVAALRRRDFADWNVRFFLWIIMATVPISAMGLLLSSRLNACGSPLRTLAVIGLACIVMGGLLAYAERAARHTRTIDNVTLLDALIVGLAQVGALIPGVSRSGSTLTAALFRGMQRDEAARFSFLLGIPTIALAGLFELFKLRKAGLGLHGWSILLFGIVIASVSAFAAIWSLMRVLERFSAWPFVVYRFLLGILLIVGVVAGVLPN